MNNKGFNLLTVICFIFVSSIISAITVGVIITNEYKGSNGTSYSDLIKDENIQEFLDVYEKVIANYYEDVDREKMLESAINGMLNYLGDNYTTYMTPSEKEALARRLEGSYRGIGITIQDCKIIDMYAGSPAEEAGLKVDDVIKKIDEKTFDTCSNEDISASIKNTDKERVKVTVLRGEEEKEFDIELQEIIIPAVKYEMIEGTNVGYLAVGIFSNNVGLQFKNAFDNLKNSGMEKLIIDLRNNTGGYLDGAKDIASMFLPKGKLIFSLENKNQMDKYYDETSESEEMPVVILINGNSASSSEILTAALKDSYGATLIGTKSYGKGKVQQTYSLEDGGMAKYTTALWLRPNGECIDGVGIQPDIEVSDVTSEGEIVDNSLNKAVEYLTSN